MPSNHPVPAVIYWLTALTAAAPVVVVAAVAATRFGGADLAVTYDLLTWTVAKGLAWAGLAAALVVTFLALRDLRGRGVYALIALVLAVGSVGVFVYQGQRLAQATPRDVSTNPTEPPSFSRLASVHRGPAPAESATCATAHPIPSQLLSQQAVSALVDAGFPVVRATTFEVEAVHEGAWFGFTHDAVVRIRPGRTDVRVATRGSRPDGGAACRLLSKIVANLDAAR